MFKKYVGSKVAWYGRNRSSNITFRCETDHLWFVVYFLLLQTRYIIIIINFCSHDDGERKQTTTTNVRVQNSLFIFDI